MSAQSMEALALAKRTRSARAIVTRAFTAGDLSLEDALSAECCWTPPLWRLLAFLPWWGRERARRVLSPLGLDVDMPVGALTNAERRLLAAACEREIARLGRRR